ncbi:MAG: hypothetical protein N2745_05670 [Syntrophorhabdaceae bacterium]|nr:hypothetical protein [Syntrophorhabdaceae bacterium]
MPCAWRIRFAGKKGGKKLRIPDEYVCSLCGFVFLSGEKVDIFCPECGSSMVAKEITYEEFLDDEDYTFNPRFIMR